MANELTPIGDLALAGQVANQLAGKAAWTDYRERLAPNTRNRQDNDLALFAAYLAEKGLPAGEVARNLDAWRGVTWGLVAGFMRWQLAQSYAVSTVNIRLATIKAYCRLAVQAGAMEAEEYAQIRTVKSYRRAEAKHIDEAREAEGIPTRRPVRWVKGERANRKAESTLLTQEQAKALKMQSDIPQGRRDRLLICLLLDHGLRVGELAGLTIDNFDLKAGELRFYRPKVHKVQIHRLERDALQAARDYLASDAPALGPIWRASASKRDGKAKKGQLTRQGMSTRALTERVRTLGAALGIASLTAHDCRHYWATQAARSGTHLDRLKEAGGWSSLAMPERYIEAARIANEGVKLE